MQKRTCPKCGAEVFASDDVCMDCGADLAERRHMRAAPPAEPSPATEAPDAGPTASPVARWLWVPALRSPGRYPVLRIYQYVCMLSAWGSLLSGVGGAVFLVLGWASVRGALPPLAAGLDLLAVALAVGVTLLWSVFWAFTLRAAVEAIQVYLDIETNTRWAAEAMGRPPASPLARAPGQASRKCSAQPPPGGGEAGGEWNS